MSANDNERELFHIETICRRLPWVRPKPIDPGNYCAELTGDWNDVPAWAIRRINFLEEVNKHDDKQRCPRMNQNCPNEPTMSCHSIKHCYPYLCDGSCGHNEIWVSDDEKKMLAKYRKEKYG